MRALSYVVALVLIGLLGLVACGEEEEFPPNQRSSLDEYLRGLEAVRLRELERNYDDPSDGDVTSEAGLAHRSDIHAMLRDQVADLEALNPPEEVAGAHDRFLEAVRWATRYTEDFLSRASAAESDEERDALNAEFLEAPQVAEVTEEFTVSCSELQRAADVAAVDVSLNCDGRVTVEDRIEDLLKAGPGAPTCEADACLCDLESCPKELRVTLNGIPGRILLKSPPLPPHLIDVSVYIEFDPGGSDLFEGEIRLPLPTDEDSEESLGFYSYLDGQWQREADVTLIYDRRVAKGRFNSLPPNLRVLREAD